MLRLRALVYEKLKAAAVVSVVPSMGPPPQSQWGFSSPSSAFATLGSITQNCCAVHSVEPAWSRTPCTFNTLHCSSFGGTESGPYLDSHDGIHAALCMWESVTHLYVLETSF